jgi:uncharacterized DUF497 family protein
VNGFRWNEWNREHATRHGVSQWEAEHAVDNSTRGLPIRCGKKKLMVQGRGEGGRIVQVVYLLDPEGTIYIIHAMPLTTRRRRGKRG